MNIHNSTTHIRKSGNLGFTLFVVTLIAAIFGLTYSLTAPLVALKLSEQGVGETMIGLNAAMHALGVLLIAPALPALSAKYGAVKLIIAALLTTSVLILCFPAMPSYWLWFPLRFGLGIAAEILFVLTETWASELSTNTTRGRVMAFYTALLSLGFAGGPLILSFTGTDGGFPYLVGAALVLLALLLLLSSKLITPAPQTGGSIKLLKYIRLSPLAMLTTGLNAGIETAGLSFLSLYAIRLGWDEQSGTQLLTMMMAGAIILQLPIGWVGDKIDRFKLMVILLIICVIGAAIWPFLLQEKWLAYPALFIWGGAFVGLYTTMLAIIGTRYKGSDLVGIYAAIGIFWGAGALLGPSLAGFAQDVTKHGLPIFVSLMCLVFLSFLIMINQRSKTDKS